MNTPRLAVLAAFTLLLVPHLSAQAWTSSRPDGHAPIGVMGDHTHGSEEMMVSARTMFMGMSGSRLGTDSISDADIVSTDGEGFRVTPSEMPMRMDMVGLMYAPNRRLTLMAMIPFITNTMDHKSRPSVAADPDAIAFTTGSSGIGDVSLTGLVLLADPGRSRIHAGVGVSFPSGSITEVDDTPMGVNQQLPYPMQLGSGSLAIKPSLTYLGQSDRFGWGAQGRLTVQTGENQRAYTLGPRGGVSAWSSVLVSEALSLSARVDGQAWGNIDGGDPAYAMAVQGNVVPTVRSDLRAGERVDVSVGLNAYAPSGPLAGLRGAIEVAAPVYQRLAGPQLETDLIVTLGAQYAFDL